MATLRPSDLDGAEIVRRIRARELSAVEAVTAAIEAIARHDGAIRAFSARADALALARARALDGLDRASAMRLPLLGVPVAIKDIFDTAELPTEYGSPIYRGHQPTSDAALVALLRAAGAVVVGKTKTAEFACMTPADTRNPLDPGRTPGGSSSGSAAAVAARLVPLATGTQTAGSVVRPASYCGVLGFKPTLGVVPLAGALPVSATLDTAGFFARSVDDLELALAAASRAPAGAASARSSRPLDGCGPAAGALAGAVPRIAFARMAWELLEVQARAAVERYVEAAAAAGADIEEAELPMEFERVAAAQLTIQRAETAWALGPEADRHGDAVSAALRAYIAAGRAVSREDYLAARRLADEERWRWNEWVAGFDAVLAPSTLDEPPGLETTGDPLLCRPFTLLGVPALAIPGAYTAAGLPIGVQLAGALHDDRRVLACGRWLLARVPAPAPRVAPLAVGEQ